MAPDADYYLEYAAQVEATSPGLAEILRERAAALSGSAARVPGVPPATGTVTPQPPTRPMAYRSMVIPSEDRATGQIGRQRDIRGDIRQMQEGLTDVERGLVDYYMIQDGMAPDEARAKAQEDISNQVMSMRFNVEGQPEYGRMEGWLPMTRESRIITRRVHDPQTGELKEVDLYYDPDTKDFREPTASEYAVEAFAKQEILSPEKIGKMMTVLRQQVSDITRQLNYDIGSPEEQAAFDEKYRQVVAETFDDWFMYTEPGTAKTIETFTGAALRSWPAITSTAVNTALMGYLPLYWEQDESGQPVDKDSWAYRIHENLVSVAQKAGMSEEEARSTLQGGYELPTPVNLYNVLGAVFGPDSTVAQIGAALPDPVVPIPFQPVKRTQATTVDPYGQRVASATGNFIVDVFQNLRRGRSMGDELMSISALAEDRADNFYRAREGWKESSAAGKNTIYEYVGTTSPYWYGVGMEMLYGIGPFSSIAKLARAGEKGLNTAAKIADAPSLAKLGFVGAHPIEAAARSQTLRVVGDLFEGKSVSDDPLDILTEANNVRRVAGEYGSREMLTPYLMLAYLNAAEGMRQAATAFDLRGIYEGSEAGVYVMDRAGLSTLDAAHPVQALDAGQVSKIRESVYRWIASAYRPGVETILNNPALNDAEKFRRIQEFLKEAGANQKVFPTLKNSDRLELNEWVKTLFHADDGAGALPIQPGKPVLQSVHKLGADVVTASRKAEWGEVTGPLGRIVNRRLGNAKMGPDLIYRSPRRVAEAARAAGGRAIEATIENIVPDDYVFVTRELMAPRKLLTRDVYKRVADRMEGFDAAFNVKAGTQKVDGRVQNVVTVKEGSKGRVLDEMDDVFGAYLIKRSEDLTRIQAAIRAGDSITETDKAFLRDAVVTEAFRVELTPSRGTVEGEYSRARTGFGGEQAERAMVEGVNVGLGTAPGGRVARRRLGDFARRTVPMVISEGGGRQIMSAVRKALRKAGVVVEEPPPVDYEKMSHLPVQRMIEDLKNQVGSISDNFQRELRDAAIDSDSPENAFNSVIQKRITADTTRAVRDLEHEARRYMDMGLSEADAWYRVAYTQAEDTGVGLGEQVGLGVVSQQDAIRSAENLVQEKAWSDIIALYFDRADFELIQPALESAVKVGDDYLDVTVKNVRDVIGTLRETNKSLADAGAATNFLGIPTSLSQDAIAEVLTAFAVGRDRERITAQLLKTLRSQHPEVWVDLVPSAYSSRPDMVRLEQELTLKNRRMLLNKLLDEANLPWEQDAGWRARADELGIFTEAGVSAQGLLKFKGGSAIGREFDLISGRIYNSLSGATRKQVVDVVLKDILSLGTVNLSFDRLFRDHLHVFKAFKKDAAIQAVGKVFERLLGELAAGRLSKSEEALAEVLRDAVATRAGKIKGSRSSRAKETKALNDIAATVAVGIMRQSFYSVIAPAVREVLSNARAMGFTPGTGPQSLNNIVVEAASIDIGPSVLLMGDDYVQALKELKGAARDGRLIENLEMLRQRDRLRKARKGEPAKRGESAWEFAKHLVLDAVYSTRTMAASGLLAGGFYTRGPWSVPIPAPNMRYIGANLLTAPLIALTTVGAASALKAARGVGWGEQARDVARQVSGLLGGKLVDATSSRAADDVVFTSVTGRKWTWAELQDAMDRNNIMITRGSVEFQESWMRDVLRDAKLTSKGVPAGRFRNFLRTFDPLRTNIFQYAANATDRAFRQNMFASALKEGLTEQQAAQLGRAVVLDYGRLPVGLRATMNRVLLFIAFRASMTVELLEALARDPGTFNRQLLLMRDSQQASTQYMLGPDYAKARLVLDPTEYVFDGTAGAMNYGPTHPAVDAFFDLARMGQWAFHAFDEDVPTAQIAAEGIAEENLHPAMTAAIESWVTSSLRETDQGWKVPDVWAAWAVQNGPDSTWPWMKERYNLRAVMRKRDRTPGRPTVRGSTEDAYAEWYFTDVSDMRKFKKDLMLATYLGFKRTTEDWTKGLMAFYDSDYIDEKRRGNVPFFPFMTGLLTPIGAKDPEQVISQALFEQRRAAGQLKPKLERR